MGIPIIWRFFIPRDIVEYNHKFWCPLHSKDAFYWTPFPNFTCYCQVFIFYVVQFSQPNHPLRKCEIFPRSAQNARHSVGFVSKHVIPYHSHGEYLIRHTKYVTWIPRMHKTMINHHFETFNYIAARIDKARVWIIPNEWGNAHHGLTCNPEIPFGTSRIDDGRSNECLGGFGLEWIWGQLLELIIPLQIYWNLSFQLFNVFDQ